MKKRFIMVEKKDENGHIHCSKCAKCSKIISISMAHSVECVDYILHFCGPECYDHWIKHHEVKNNENTSSENGGKKK